MNFRYLLLLLPVVFFCCKKKQDTNGTANPADNKFAYTVAHEPVISCAANSVYYFSFTIKVLSGDINTNKLTCSLEGLPPAVAVAPSSMVVGNMLGGIFKFDIASLAVGDYPFLLNVKSEKYGLQTYNATLKVVAATDYAPLLAGIFDSCYDYCPDSGFIHYPSQVSTVPDTPFLLKITNIKNMGSGFVVRAWVSKSIRIPVQEVGGKTIWGSGTYGQDGRPGHGGDYVMAIKDTIVTGTDTLTCTAHIEH